MHFSIAESEKRRAQGAHPTHGILAFEVAFRNFSTFSVFSTAHFFFLCSRLTAHGTRMFFSPRKNVFFFLRFAQSKKYCLLLYHVCAPTGVHAPTGTPAADLAPGVSWRRPLTHHTNNSRTHTTCITVAKVCRCVTPTHTLLATVAGGTFASHPYSTYCTAI